MRGILKLVKHFKEIKRKFPQGRKIPIHFQGHYGKFLALTLLTDGDQFASSDPVAASMDISQ